MVDEPDNIVLQMLRGIRAEMATKAEIADVRAEVADLRRDIADLKTSIADVGDMATGAVINCFGSTNAFAIRGIRPYIEPGRRSTPAIEQALGKSLLFAQGLKFERDILMGASLVRGEQGPAVTG